MQDAAFYQQQAEQCRQLAETSKIPEIRRRLVVLAEQYRVQARDLAARAPIASPPIATAMSSAVDMPAATIDAPSVAPQS